MKIHAFRLLPGQDLRKEIEVHLQAKAIQAGWVLTCVGSLTQVHIRFANQDKGTLLTGHFEIVSLVGTLSVNGSHLHISVSDSSGQTIGGHLLSDNIIYTTAEIVIGSSDEMIFTREKDDVTGWAELKILNERLKIEPESE